MLLDLLLFVFGLVLLILGADGLVRGASALAKRLGVSELAVGLTVVAFGTSMPELVVNVFASMNAHPEIVFGNIIGSNNFNLFVILGISGLITPLAVQSTTVWREIPFSFLATVLLFVLANETVLNPGARLVSRLEGGLLLLLFVLFLTYLSRRLKVRSPDNADPDAGWSGLKTAGFILSGLAGLVLGGKLAVDHAVSIAARLGADEKLIGLTLVAAGTSLPELAASVAAALRKHIDIAVGNVIGSNLFNILLILPVSALIRPAPYDASFNTDLLLLVGGTLFLFTAMFTGQRKKLDRWEAGLLLFVFIGYMVVLIRLRTG